jgi:hypothetical protein
MVDMSETPHCPDCGSPLANDSWSEVLERAVARSPEQRFASPSALARALEEVITRVEGAEDGEISPPKTPPP